MVFVLPPKSQVGALDPEIAGEGLKVLMSDGDQVDFIVQPPTPVIPDLSKIKSLARYFNRVSFSVWPAWLYHPTEAPRIVKNADQAAALGVCYRAATIDEKGRYGLSHVWDWTEETAWRPKPHAAPQFNPKAPDTGKNYMASAPDPVHAQSVLLAELIPAVAAAVAQSLQANGPAKPANIDAGQWAEFLKFQAWQKAQETVSAIADETERAELARLDGEDAVPSILSKMSDDELRTELTKIAVEKGIKVKKTWGIDDIKSALDKAA